MFSRCVALPFLLLIFLAVPRANCLELRHQRNYYVDENDVIDMHNFTFTLLIKKIIYVSYKMITCVYLRFMIMICCN